MKMVWFKLTSHSLSQMSPQVMMMVSWNTLVLYWGLLQGHVLGLPAVVLSAPSIHKYWTGGARNTMPSGWKHVDNLLENSSAMIISWNFPNDPMESWTTSSVMMTGFSSSGKKWKISIRRRGHLFLVVVNSFTFSTQQVNKKSLFCFVFPEGEWI